jgi:glycine cleavage system aminomethyltransferase T
MAKRVFFAFYYEDVKSFRANVVRNHWVTKDDREDAGFFDASLWESTKKRGDDAVRSLINSGLDNTSATVVLIGTETYSRRWVRYEIIKSMQRGNIIFGVHINSIKDKYQYTKIQGPNPFEYLGVRYNSDGTALKIYEFTNAKWQEFADISGYSLKNPRPREQWGNFYQLTKWHATYDWVSDNGYDNFSDWVEK